MTVSSFWFYHEERPADYSIIKKIANSTWFGFVGIYVLFVWAVYKNISMRMPAKK